MLIRTTGCLPQVFRAKLRGKEEVAVKIFQLSARIESEVRPCDHMASSHVPTASPDAHAFLVSAEVPADEDFMQLFTSCT